MRPVKIVQTTRNRKAVPPATNRLLAVVALLPVFRAFQRISTCFKEYHLIIDFIVWNSFSGLQRSTLTGEPTLSQKVWQISECSFQVERVCQAI
jgi:hypothetical protein